MIIGPINNPWALSQYLKERVPPIYRKDWTPDISLKLTVEQWHIILRGLDVLIDREEALKELAELDAKLIVHDGGKNDEYK